MARYLTPSKVGLLLLVELYCTETLANEAILPVLSFVTSHVTDLEPGTPPLHSSPSSSVKTRWRKAERTISLLLDIHDFEALLSPYQSTRGIPGRTLWDSFLVRTWGIDSLDVLYSFFGRLLVLIASPNRTSNEEEERLAATTPVQLSRTSPFGVFVRRCQVEFTRLQFHDMAELWKAFIVYRQPTAAYLGRRNSAASRLSFDHVLVAGEHDQWARGHAEELATVAYGDISTVDARAGRLVSRDDVESLLEFQIEQVQKHGSRIPFEIRNQFSSLLNDAYMVPSLTHYLSFMDAWRAGDFPTAFDFLHRYFDYTMQNRDRSFYQYALMNLAVLQADFGCYHEALTAMLETVSTARENRDMTCLNFSLNWLFHFSCAHPRLVADLDTGGGSASTASKESLAFLRVKARETEMWPLWSAVLLSEAKLGLLNGDSIATSLEYMVRSSQVMVEHNMTNMFASQLGLQAALWDRLGIASWSATTCEVYLRCHSRLSLFDDELRMSCRLALSLTARGKYDEALRRLEGVDVNSLRAWKPGQFWYKYLGVIKLRRDLHHDNLEGAEQLLSQLLQNRMDAIEPDLAFLIDALHMECMGRRGDLGGAFDKVEKMLDDIQTENNDTMLRARLLLLKAQLYDRSGHAQRGFTVAVRAASMSWKARLVPTLWESIGAVANVLTSLGEFGASVRLLSAVLPRALESDVALTTAKLYSLFADAHMGMAGQSPRRSSKRMEGLTRALTAVQRAFDYYSAVEDVRRQAEMMAKKATIMRLGGDTSLAADYASAHVVLKREAAASMVR